MAVLLQTNIGEIIIDLAIDEVPILSANFIKLCKLKAYNNSVVHSVEKNFVARTGIPISNKEQSILSLIKSHKPKSFDQLCSDKNEFWKSDSFDHATGNFLENFHPRLRHSKLGVVAMANDRPGEISAAFYITLRDSIDYLDNKRSIIGHVAEGFDVISRINDAIVEDHVKYRPLHTIRILHTIILHDPFPDPPGLPSPLPTSPLEVREEVLVEGESAVESEIIALEHIAQSEAKSRAVALEILGDVPDADLAPPDNVLFICKLNPITEAQDLELIFSRFGAITSCDIIRDWKTGDSLQYGFIEYEDSKSCDAALFKMEGALIDDRRIHVDFCQSVPKQWGAYKSRGPRQQAQPPLLLERPKRNIPPGYGRRGKRLRYR